MKPIVSALNAWTCTILSLFAILILSTIGLLFKHNHHTLTGSTADPPDTAAVAGMVFSAVLVYVVFLVFCGLQAWLNARQGARGAITLR